jgi:hypothetical protein
LTEIGTCLDDEFLFEIEPVSVDPKINTSPDAMVNNSRVGVDVRVPRTGISGFDVVVDPGQAAVASMFEPPVALTKSSLKDSLSNLGGWGYGCADDETEFERPRDALPRDIGCAPKLSFEASRVASKMIPFAVSQAI